MPTHINPRPLGQQLPSDQQSELSRFRREAERQRCWTEGRAEGAEIGLMTGETSEETEKRRRSKLTKSTETMRENKISVIVK